MIHSVNDSALVSTEKDTDGPTVWCDGPQKSATLYILPQALLRFKLWILSQEHSMFHFKLIILVAPTHIIGDVLLGTRTVTLLNVQLVCTIQLVQKTTR